MYKLIRNEGGSEKFKKFEHIFDVLSKRHKNYVVKVNGFWKHYPTEEEVINSHQLFKEIPVKITRESGDFVDNYEIAYNIEIE